MAGRSGGRSARCRPSRGPLCGLAVVDQARGRADICDRGHGYRLCGCVAPTPPALDQHQPLGVHSAEPEYIAQLLGSVGRELRAVLRRKRSGYPSLEFPGSRTGAYADYVYFSIAVSTTFGATDVSIKTPAMRRVVNFHIILTFIYNSVIVALLASLLIR